MKQKIETGVIMLCALLLGTGVAASKADPCFQCLGFQEAVPEVDFRSVGSVGVGTLLMVLGYTVRKGVRKFTDRKQD